MATVTETYNSRGSGDAQFLSISGAEAQTPVEDSFPTSPSASSTKLFNAKTNWKIFATNYAIFAIGISDASLGPLIPYLKRHYDIGLAFVALVYIINFVGCMASALAVVHMTARFGLGGVLIFGSILQLTSHLLMFWAPPYPLYVCSFFVLGMGIGVQDSQSNAYIANLPRSPHLFLGLLHALYGAGALIAPVLATIIATKWQWNYYYVTSIGVEFFNVVFLSYAFRDDVLEIIKNRGKLENEERNEEAKEKKKKANKDFKKIWSRRDVWILAMFFFVYVGVEVTAGGWVVEFMIEVRHGEPSKVGYIASAFWGGLTIGRIILADITNRFGVRQMVFIYTALALAVQLVFWFVPQITVGAVMIGLLGFFIGPFFPAGITLASQLLPYDLQAGAIGLTTAVGASGAAAFPFLTGAVAAKKGVQVLQPILVGLLAALAILWALIPRSHKNQQATNESHKATELTEVKHDK